MSKKILILIFFSCFFKILSAQEINGKVTVLSAQIKSTVDKKTFQTLQTALTNFINGRKWTNDAFQQNEKIAVNFLLNLTGVLNDNVYKASLTIQAGRPIYNSAYISPIINFQDNDIVFKYAEFQPLDFNENRVQGTEPLQGNLTAVFAYYIDLILGLDYDSFSPRGGDQFFLKAQNIVANAPEESTIAGWKAFDGMRNRYWLTENFTNSKYALIHDAYYLYYRLGMDKMYEDENEARQQLLNSLNSLNTLFTDNPNLMVMYFFFLRKSDELVNAFKKAPPQDKARAMDILQRLDVSNISKYKQGLK